MNELSFNLLLFAGWLFGLGYKVAYTDYKIATGKDIIQLAFSLCVVMLFWFVDQYFLLTSVGVEWYWKILAAAVYFTFGWANVILLLLIVQKTTTIIESKINKKTTELTTTETTEITKKP